MVALVGALEEEYLTAIKSQAMGWFNLVKEKETSPSQRYFPIPLAPQGVGLPASGLGLASLTSVSLCFPYLQHRAQLCHSP